MCLCVYSSHVIYRVRIWFGHLSWCWARHGRPELKASKKKGGWKQTKEHRDIKIKERKRKVIDQTKCVEQEQNRMSSSIYCPALSLYILEYYTSSRAAVSYRSSTQSIAGLGLREEASSNADIRRQDGHLVGRLLVRLSVCQVQQ